MRRFAVLAAAAVVLVGCNRISTLLESGPEGALRSYLNASTQGDLETAYGFVSASDRAARSVAEYQSAEGNAFASAFAGIVTHKIVNVTEYGATATAQVDVTAPDVSQLMGDLIGPAFATAFGGGEIDSDKLAQDLANKYKNADLPKITRRNEYHLVRDPDGWRVFMNWERTDRISDLVSEAKRLHEARDLAAAATTYEKGLELDPVGALRDTHTRTLSQNAA